MKTTNAMLMVIDINDFFGCGLEKVNPILLRIGSDIETRPEWLRGKPALVNLPRWSDNATYDVKITRRVTPGDIGERIVWVVEELKYGWKLTPNGFSFVDANESVHFKLRWG